MAEVPSAVILEPKKIKSDTASTVSPSISHEVMRPVETVSDYFFLAPKSLQMVTTARKLKDTYSLEEKL